MQEEMTPVGRVYLIAQPSVKRNGSMPDLSPLAAHGDLTVLVEAGVYPSYNPDRAINLILTRMDDFDYNYDMVAWAGGDTLSAIMAGIALAELNVPWFWFLRYSRHRDKATGQRLNEGSYQKVKVFMTDVMPPEGQSAMEFDVDEEPDEDAKGNI